MVADHVLADGDGGIHAGELIVIVVADEQDVGELANLEAAGFVADLRGRGKPALAWRRN
jgi:hypothetical protein